MFQIVSANALDRLAIGAVPDLFTVVKDNAHTFSTQIGQTTQL